MSSLKFFKLIKLLFLFSAFLLSFLYFSVVFEGVVKKRKQKNLLVYWSEKKKRIKSIKKKMNKGEKEGDR